MSTDLIHLRFPDPRASSAATLARWLEMVQREFGLDCRIHKESAFQAKVRSWDIGTVKLVKMALNGHSVMSERRIAPKSDPQYLLVKLVLGGRVVFEQSGRCASAGTGGLVVIDPAREFNAAFFDCPEIVEFLLPKSELKERGLAAEVDGLLLNSFSTPDTTALWHFLLATANHAGNTSETLRARLGAQVMDLADYLIGSSDKGLHSRTAAVNRVRVKRYILRRLGDPNLDTAEIAAATQLSPRSINRLFAAEGTSLMRYLWNCRLERAQAMLQHAAGTRISIEKVAWRCGFSDAAHFSRSFKGRYGSSPREFRRAFVAGMSSIR